MMSRIKRWVKNLKYHQKLRLALILTSAVPIVILGFTSYYLSSQSLRENVLSNMQDSSKKIQYIVSRSMERHMEFALRLTSDDDFIRFSKGNETEFEYSSTSGYAHEIRKMLLDNHIDESNFKIYSSYSNIKGGFFEEIDAQTLDEYKSLYGPFGISFINEEKTFRLMAGVTDFYSEEIIGYIEITFDSESFFKDYAVVNYPEYGIVVAGENSNPALLREDGKKVVFSKLYMERVNTNMPLEIISGTNGSVAYHGRTYMSGSTTVPETGWTITCFVPQTVIDDSLKQVSDVSLGLCFISLILVIVITLAFSKSLITRIQVLMREIEKVKNGGSLTVNLQNGPNDEIGQLTEIFETMLKSINQYILDVYQSDIDLKEAELKALQAQINPHFLYNCLNMINWRAEDLHDEKISRVVMNLSNFYRTSLNKGKSQISILDELLNACSYIDIQLDLHNNNFDVIYEIDEGLMEYETINLSLQPIIENAIEHGVNSVEISVNKNARGRIKLSVIDAGDNILFRVFNIGPSIDEKTVHKIFTEKSIGYGLYNVHDRIRKRFGEKYGITIYPVPGGTECTITVPKVRWEGEYHAKKKKSV